MSAIAESSCNDLSPHCQSKAPRILISRLSAIGDVILTLPVASALRDHYPHAFIAWVVETNSASMVQNHVAVDEVIELSGGWYTSPSNLLQTRRRLREFQFDITVDCQGNTKSSLAGWLANAKRRIGFSGRHAMELSGLFNNEKIAPVFTHVTDRSLELLSALDIHHPVVRWDLPIPETVRSWARGYRATIPASRVATLNPGGTWASKLWEPDRFASTARYLRDRYGYQSLVVWGTFNERLMAEEIVALSEGAATLAPDTTPHSLAALIATTDLFIAGDTGPLHMAVAVGVRTIGLYGATRPGDCGPYNQTALQLQYEGGSRRHRQRIDNRAMRAIGVEHVCDLIDQMHAGTQTKRKQLAA